MFGMVTFLEVEGGRDGDHPGRAWQADSFGARSQPHDPGASGPAVGLLAPDHGADRGREPLGVEPRAGQARIPLRTRHPRACRGVVRGRGCPRGPVPGAARGHRRACRARQAAGLPGARPRAHQPRAPRRHRPGPRRLGGLLAPGPAHPLGGDPTGPAARGRRAPPAWSGERPAPGSLGAARNPGSRPVSSICPTTSRASL